MKKMHEFIGKKYKNGRIFFHNTLKKMYLCRLNIRVNFI